MYHKETAELLFAEAMALGLSPEWVIDYGLISVVIKNQKYYIFANFSLLNSQGSSYLTKNKHITRKILEENNLPNIPYLLPQTLQQIDVFLKEHKLIIAKPTLGSHSQDIYLVKAINAIEQFDFHEFIFEKYIKGKEFRYLVIQEKVVAVHQKYHETTINDPAVVRRISYLKNEWDKKLVALAIKVTHIMHLSFAAVDFLIDGQNSPFILEVNSAPGLWHFHHPAEGPAVNIAKMLLEAMVASIYM